jgi:hypothetical protein
MFKPVVKLSVVKVKTAKLRKIRHKFLLTAWTAEGLFMLHICNTLSNSPFGFMLIAHKEYVC